ncbi:MAG: hypothetical protein J0H66_06765 [Solirubrobacterales bacterium]|nr:hypothetical protein [Solirubrobacterales bacterium]OJU94874.1 MAG: hypothetical protein BGO23_06770 [Solirubrobacterales bacterium 67-14]
MTESAPPQTSPDQDQGGRIPRLAIAVVVLGVVASLAIYGLSFVPGNGSEEIGWDTLEPIKSPAPAKVGDGSFTLARTSLSAIAPNDDGLLLYRVSGIVRVDSGGRKMSRVRCDVFSRVRGDTRMARSTKLRAAWPRPSSGADLHRQAVPETSTVKFQTENSKKIDLPIRDVIQRYVDTNAMVTVDWDGYTEDDQNWEWELPDGSGVGTTTLPWAVIFESETRPRGSIECKAQIGAKSATLKAKFLQDEWPITDDQPNTDDADTGDVSNVQ